MDLKDRFNQIEEISSHSASEREIRIAKITGFSSEIIPWKSDFTALVTTTPKSDSSWDSTLDLFQKTLTQFLKLDSVQLNVLNISESGTNIVHELAVLFAQAEELPFEIEGKTVSFRIIDQNANLDIALHPDTKNLVKEAVEYATAWNKKYQNQLKMNFSFMLGKANLKISYRAGTASKKKIAPVYSEVKSEI